MAKTATDIIDLEGLEDLNHKLDLLCSLPDEVLLTAVFAGATPVREDAEAHAPGPEIIGVVQMEKGQAVARIGPDKDHWYYRFFEFGATVHEITGKPLLIFEGAYGTVFARQVKAAGGLAAKPFLRPALDHQRQQAIENVKQALLLVITEIANGGR